MTRAADLARTESSLPGWLWGNYLRQHRGQIALVALCSLGLGLVSQQFLLRTESGLRIIFNKGVATDLLNICAVVAVLFTLRAGLSYLIPLIMTRIGTDLVLTLRRDLQAHLLRLDMLWFDKARAGDVLNTLVGQPQELGTALGTGLANALRDVVTVGVVAVYLCLMSPLLSLAALIVVPGLIWTMIRVSGRVRHRQRDAERAMADYLSGLEQTLSGIRTIKISGQEAAEEQRLSVLATGLRRAGRRAQKAQSLTLPAIDLASALVYLLVIGGGGLMVLDPRFDMDGATLITFLIGMVMLIEPARLLVQFLGSLSAQMVRAGQIRALFGEQPRISNAAVPLERFDATGDIELDAVRFGYAPDMPVLERLSMTLPGGKISAIVGETGAGKSTIMALLPRLYDLNGGEIRIGGTPLPRIALKTLRGAFSVVSQDIVIFDGSLRDNIRYSRPEASAAEVDSAIDLAGLRDLVERRGDLRLGPRGVQLSGGQKQRVAIARAILRDAPILLLDEATSALDPHTENRIRAALAGVMRGRTAVIVAHRLSAVRDADRIFVLHSGQLIEEGTHGELLAAGGHYATIYRLQETDDAP